MKKLTLIFILISSFTVKAQFPPNLLSPYQSPTFYNTKLDSSFVPGVNYRINRYDYNNNINSQKLELSNYYIVETDDYLITKYTNYPVNVTGQQPPNNIEKNIYRYSYLQNKLNTITYSFKGLDSANEYFFIVDSFNYNNNLLNQIAYWRIGYQNKLENYENLLFRYDSLMRCTGYYGNNGTLEVVDSFTLNNLPASAINNNSYHFHYKYDSLSRPVNIIEYLQYNDSFVFYYSSNRNFPDSILEYYAQSSNNLIGKTIFSYTSNGKISEIDYYENTFGIYQMTSKEIYSEVTNVGLQTINSTHKNINIYPNPATDKLFIQSTKEKVFSYKIMDMQGKILANEKLNSESISLNGISNGIFVVQLYFSNGTTISKRILKME